VLGTGVDDDATDHADVELSQAGMCEGGSTEALPGVISTQAETASAGVGVTISAPSAVGLIWHATPRMAIRPDLSFSFSESDADVGTDINSSSFTLGASVLFYTGRWDNLQTYVAPRLSYSWASSAIDGAGASLDSSQDGWSLAGTFGPQYLLGTRFAVFAEAGLAYASQTSETPTSFGDNERTTRTFGTRTLVGAALYF
jgi:hypothetical protein